MNKRWTNYLGLVLVAALWGANFGVSRKAMETFDPILFAFLRFGLAVPFFFLFVRMREGSVGIPWRAALQLAGIGLVGVTALEIAVMYSIKYTTLANASLLNVAPWPIFAALFAPLFLREKITSRLLWGGAAAIAGVSFVILGGADGFSLSSEHLIGDLLAFGVSVIGGLYNVVCMPLMARYSALRISAWFILFGAAFMFPFTLGSWSKVDWTGLSASHYSAIGYNVLICTVFSFVVWNACMYRVGAARSNFFRYVVPASAVAAGYLFFGETVSGWQLAGTVLMAAGLIWISLERAKPAPHPKGQPEISG
ncbi:EamA family transporter [Cohnella sp. CFH 77786]|uniref:DMT family transporter n=1 Tax=Cohnella sp. CFH 77786 TaxID=2662265 RepID=UPI001C6089BB|nr:DMT family transporter [Cohnella sp. CFH 77786]MBW5445592.1 EamA family transporter [Cohnella sp. CFH 77786]